MVRMGAFEPVPLFDCFVIDIFSIEAEVPWLIDVTLYD